MIRQTGGCEFGATSTRSNPRSSAILMASFTGRTPTCFPSGSMTRTSGALISQLIDTSLTIRFTSYGTFFLYSLDQFFHFHGWKGLPAAGAGGERVLLHFSFTQNHHIRDLLNFRFPDFQPQLLIAEVLLGTNPRLHELLVEHLAVGNLGICDRKQNDLHRGQPGGESAGIMLDQHPDQTLHRPQADSMNHHRSVLLSILSDIDEIKALGHGKITLDGGTLPLAFQSVFELYVDLRSVKSPLAFID